MNEEYTENNQATSVRKANVLHHQLSRTLVDNHFKTASIHLVDTSFGNAIPSEIKFGHLNETCCDYISYPILYQKRKIGDLWLEDAIDVHNKSAVLPSLTKKIALLIKRFQATELTEHYIGKELCLAGYSDQLLILEDFIEKAASASCPVIISGPVGSECLSVASAIHCNSNISEQPFVEINCVSANEKTFQRQVLRAFKRAQGGSVFINNIDELSLEQQNILTELLSSRVKLRSSFYERTSADNVRLLVSTSRSLGHMVERKQFSRKLYAEFNFLSVVIPPLSARKEDIPSIVDKLMCKYRTNHDQFFTPEAISLLQTYAWPENHEELERVVARVASLTSEIEIDVIQVIEFAPEITEESTTTYNDFSTVRLINTESGNTDRLIEILLNQRFEMLEGFHPGLQKALKYLSHNYCQEITLSLLSSNAFISPSHLSFLFKSTLSISFKPLLAGMRIERAKQILKGKPNSRITDVSLEVGFGDLSHFEKIFKRLTGMTPRDYKNQCKNPL